VRIGLFAQMIDWSCDTCLSFLLGPPGPPGPPGSPGAPAPGAPSVPAKPRLPAKKKATPSVPLKQFHWVKLDDAAVEGTCFEAIMKEEQKAGEMQLDTAAIEELFAAKAVTKKEEAPADGPAASAPKGFGMPVAAKKEVISLIDPKRSQAIEIAISRLKIPHEQLKEALLNCDESILTIDRLSSLIPSMPTTEELSSVREWLQENGGAGTADTSSLGATEKFFLVLVGVTGTPGECIEIEMSAGTLPGVCSPDVLLLYFSQIFPPVSIISYSNNLFPNNFPLWNHNFVLWIHY
jgi:hypothetical protein